MIDTRPVRRVEFVPPDDGVDEDRWPHTVPAVRQLRAEGMELAPVTVLVGENGSGKSTLVEAVALAYGLSAEGGSTGARHSTRVSESDLHRHLRLSRGVSRSPWGFFLRAETMHGFFTYLEDNPTTGRRSEPEFHAMSHGESFLTVLASRFDAPGFFCLDEPESALSFAGCLSLVATLHDVVAAGGQVVVATHSPVVASVPGARILEVGDWGLRETRWEELDLVASWRTFLADPARFHRQILRP